MLVDAQHFHPMLGHVEAGCIVRFTDGRQFTIKSCGTGGWVLADLAGKPVSRAADGAYDLARVIDELDRTCVADHGMHSTHAKDHKTGNLSHNASGGEGGSDGK